MSCQAQGIWQTPRVIKGDINMRYVGENTVSSTSLQTGQLSAQKSVAAVETKIEFDSYADTCVVGDQCQLYIITIDQ